MTLLYLLLQDELSEYNNTIKFPNKELHLIRIVCRDFLFLSKSNSISICNFAFSIPEAECLGVAVKELMKLAILLSIW